MFVRRAIRSALVLVLFLAWGCGPSALVGVYGPYDQAGTVTITKDGATSVPGCAPSIAGCLPGGAAACPDSKGPADVLVRDGKVIVAICYPELAGEGGKRIIEASKLKDVKTNGARVTFDPRGDGKVYDDDLKVDGNGNVIYGNGAGVTVIGGKAEFKGNNNMVRGLTILGDAKFEGNNVSLVLSVVKGDLSIKGNNAIIADVVVLGDLKVEGNNHVLMRVFVAGKVDIKGKNNQCIEGYYYQDKNGDSLWNDGEQGDPWVCK